MKKLNPLSQTIFGILLMVISPILGMGLFTYLALFGGVIICWRGFQAGREKNTSSNTPLLLFAITIFIVMHIFIGQQKSEFISSLNEPAEAKLSIESFEDEQFEIIFPSEWNVRKNESDNGRTIEAMSKS